MSDSVGTSKHNPIKEELSPEELKHIREQWVSGKWKWTLEDGSVIMSNWKKLDPKEYFLYLLQLMIQNDSSDIYFTYGEEPALRVYGEVHRVTTTPKLEDPTLEAIANLLMSDEDLELYKQNLSCDLWYSVHGRRYRINISRQRWHKMIVARLLEEKIPTIHELWLPEILVTLTRKTSGIVILLQLKILSSTYLILKNLFLSRNNCEKMWYLLPQQWNMLWDRDQMWFCFEKQEILSH